MDVLWVATPDAPCNEVGRFEFASDESIIVVRSWDTDEVIAAELMRVIKNGGSGWRNEQ